jgi:subtilisin family serine protease
MKKSIRFLLVFAIMLLAIVSSTQAQEHSFRIAIQMKPGLTAQAVTAKFLQTGSTGWPALDAIVRENIFSKVYPLFGRRNLQVRNPTAYQSLGFDRVLVLERSTGLLPLNEVQKNALTTKLRGLPEVEDVIVDQATPYAAAAAMSVNDPLYSDQWYHEKIETPKAWSYGTGTNTITIVVLDSGVNEKHPDFKPGSVVSGYDYYQNDPVSDDLLGHGTEVTGIIAAQGSNSVGIAGAAWNFQIIVHNVISSSSGKTWSLDVPQAITDAVNEGARVINMSFGTDPSTLLDKAIQYAAANDVILVACAHNYDNETEIYPAAYSEVIAVGATDDTDARVSIENNGTDWGSNYGKHLDVVAPGLDILSTTKDGDYDYDGGTSFATPQVTALAAMLRMLRPDWDRDEVKTAICVTAQDLVGLPSEDTPGWDKYMGWGRIRFGAAVQVAAVSTNCPLTASLSALAEPASELIEYYWLREKWLSGTTVGKNVTETYYSTGPAIVKALSTRVDLTCRLVDLALKGRKYVHSIYNYPNQPLSVKAKDLKDAQELAVEIHKILSPRAASKLDALIMRFVNAPEDLLLSMGIPIVVVP